MLITKEMKYVQEWMDKNNISGDPFNLMKPSIGHLLTDFLYDASREFNQTTECQHPYKEIIEKEYGDFCCKCGQYMISE